MNHDQTHAQRCQLRTCQRYHVNQLDDALYAKTLDEQLGITHQWPQDLWSTK